MKKFKNFLCGTIVFIAGCAAQPIQKIEATRIDPASLPKLSEKEVPIGIIEDAMIVEPFNLFPQSVANKINQIFKEEKNLSKALIKSQAEICDGKKERYNPSYNVTLATPKNSPGVSIDIATDRRNEFIKAAREYLKGHFFIDAIKYENTIYENGKSTSVNYNSEFHEYKTAMEKVYEGDESIGGRSEDHRLPGVVVNIPYVDTVKANELSEQYLNQYSDFDLSVIHGGGSKRFLPFLFSGIVLSQQRSIILSAKSASLFNVKWDKDDYGKMTVSSGTVAICNGGKICNTYNDAPNNIYRNTYLTPSKFAWKIKDDGIYYPLHLTYLDDLSLFVKNYTFILPKQIICQLQLDNTDNESQCENSDKYLDYLWGYKPAEADRSNMIFSADLALQHRDYIWEKIIESQTSVKEAASKNGSINFEVTLNTSLFCQYGVPVTELQSK